MADPMIDDVKELLDRKKGDERILKQIHRACENDEVISNYERNYVRKLAEEHLGRGPEEPEEPDVPDVAAQAKPPAREERPAPPPAPAPPTGPRKSRKNPTLALVAGAAALAVIVSVALAVGGAPGGPADGPAGPAALSLHTDLASYGAGDIVSISGTSPVAGSVTLAITNPAGKLAWSEQVDTKSDGRYSTLAIAGGAGWKDPGTYTITAQNASGSASSAFSFAG